MLSIRMQRLGRKGYPTYRVVVQDSRQAPTSGKYVAMLGNYNPHNKEANLEKDKAEFYLKNGAQPSDRVAALFKSEKITLPEWVKEPSEQKREIRNPEKLRKNQPEKPAEEEQAEEQQKPAEKNPVDEAEQKEEDKLETTEQKPEESDKASEGEKPEAEQKPEEKEEPESKK